MMYPIIHQVLNPRAKQLSSSLNSYIILKLYNLTVYILKNIWSLYELTITHYLTNLTMVLPCLSTALNVRYNNFL